MEDKIERHQQMLANKSKEDLGKLLQEINANIVSVSKKYQENTTNDKEKRELGDKLLLLYDERNSVIEAEKQKPLPPVAQKKKSVADRRRHAHEADKKEL